MTLPDFTNERSMLKKIIERQDAEIEILIEISSTLGEILTAIETAPPGSVVARFTLATSTTGDVKMPPAAISVDTTTGIVTLAATDDHNDPTSIQTGAVANFASDNSAVLTIGPETPGVDAAGNATVQAQLTPVGLGTANLSAAPTDASGNPFLETDGVTPIPAPASVAQPVVAGEADAFLLGDAASN
jgi:hypothetical protein